MHQLNDVGQEQQKTLLYLAQGAIPIAHLVVPQTRSACYHSRLCQEVLTMHLVFSEQQLAPCRRQHCVLHLLDNEWLSISRCSAVTFANRAWRRGALLKGLQRQVHGDFRAPKADMERIFTSDRGCVD